MSRMILIPVMVSCLLFSGSVYSENNRNNNGSNGFSEKPVFSLVFDNAKKSISFLSWDTEGGDRAGTNLLRKGTDIALSFNTSGKFRPAEEFDQKAAGDISSGQKVTTLIGKASFDWNILRKDSGFCFQFNCKGIKNSGVKELRILFPFDPAVTPTTVLPANWGDDGYFDLPLAINSPDFGQVQVKISGAAAKGFLEGSREKKTVDLIFTVTIPEKDCLISMDFDALYLPVPAKMAESKYWQSVRRGWFGAMVPSSRWGEQNRPFSAPAGVLANNVISDPASCSIWFYADQAFWTPEIAPGISAMNLVKRSLDWWLDNRQKETGEMVCYWDFLNFLDADAGPIIAAWDYVVSTGDTGWLKNRIGKLELTADFLIKRDIDSDGMVEAVQSGNYGTLKQPGRSDAWWDALNCGYKDGYTNALIYRAWRCLADLEIKAGNPEKAKKYELQADKLKESYLQKPL